MSLAGPMLFDPRVFWGDEDVKLLDWEAVAVYLKLLSAQWEEGSIPEDPRRLRAILAGGLRSPVSDEILSQALEFFEPADEGRLANPRLAGEREDWIAKKQKESADASRAGVLSGQSRRRKRDKARNARSTPVERPLNESGTEDERKTNETRTDSEPKRTPSPVPVPIPAFSESPSEKDTAANAADARVLDDCGIEIAEEADQAARSRERRARIAYLSQKIPGLDEAAKADGCADWWAWRMATVGGGKKPNAWRQLSQLRKLCKWSLRHGPSDVLRLVDLTQKNGWGGMEWSYLSGNGSGRQGDNRSREERRLAELNASIMDPPTAPAIDVRARLEALAARMPEVAPFQRERIAALARSPDGADVEKVEEALGLVEKSILADLPEILGPEVMAELEGKRDAHILRLRSKMGADQLAEAGRVILEKLMRDKAGLPELSLFAPEVEP